MKERLQTPLLIELHLRGEKPFSSNPFSSVLIREIGSPTAFFRMNPCLKGLTPNLTLPHEHHLIGNSWSICKGMPANST